MCGVQNRDFGLPCLLSSLFFRSQHVYSIPHQFATLELITQVSQKTSPFTKDRLSGILKTALAKPFKIKKRKLFY